jgi:hypothetical protein
MICYTWQLQQLGCLDKGDPVEEGFKLNYTTQPDTAFESSEDDLGTAARPLPGGAGPGPGGSFTDRSHLWVLLTPSFSSIDEALNSILHDGWNIDVNVIIHLRTPKKIGMFMSRYCEI